MGKKQEKQQLKAMDELLSLPENQSCVDCNIKGPRWAAVNIGCFLCIRCAGLHRKLGTHISVIKSTNLDIWKPEWIEFVASMGNDKVNQKYLSRGTPPNVGYLSDAEMEEFIRDKYEKQIYSKNYVPQQNATSGQYSRQLETLAAMGFNNQSACLSALEKTKGNLERTVEMLVASGKGATSPTSTQFPTPSPASTATLPSYQLQLSNMGFTNQESNDKAYNAANGNMEQAVSLLIEWQSAKRKSTPAAPKTSQNATSQQQNQSQPSAATNDLMDIFSAPSQVESQESQQFQNQFQPNQSFQFNQAASFGNQQFGQQQANFGHQQQPASFGQQNASFGQQQAVPFGQQQNASFGQQQAVPFGQQQAAPFGQQQAAPFSQQQSASFGQQQQQQQQPNPFGQQQSASLGQQQQQQPNPFGQQQQGNAFGQQQQNTSSFGQAQQQPNPFGQQNNSFGQVQQPNTFGQQNNSPFGQAQQQPNPFGQQQQQQNNTFGQAQQQPNAFGHQQTASFGQVQQPNPFGQQTNNFALQTQQNPFGQQSAQVNAISNAPQPFTALQQPLKPTTTTTAAQSQFSEQQDAFSLQSKFAPLIQPQPTSNQLPPVNPQLMLFQQTKTVSGSGEDLFGFSEPQPQPKPSTSFVSQQLQGITMTGFQTQQQQAEQQKQAQKVENEAKKVPTQKDNILSMYRAAPPQQPMQQYGIPVNTMAQGQPMMGYNQNTVPMQMHIPNQNGMPLVNQTFGYGAFSGASMNVYEPRISHDARPLQSQSSKPDLTGDIFKSASELQAISNSNLFARAQDKNSSLFSDLGNLK